MSAFPRFRSREKLAFLEEFRREPRDPDKILQQLGISKGQYYRWLFDDAGFSRHITDSLQKAIDGHRKQRKRKS